MPQMGEKVAAEFNSRVGDELCVKGPVTDKGHVRMRKYGTDSSDEPLAKILTRNLVEMEKRKPPDERFKPIIGTNHSLEGCTPLHFPPQAHHLIPLAYLPKHSICVFLAKKACKAKGRFKLTGDTDFDADHARNGYFMPYASGSKQWADASNEDVKQRLVEYVMCRTRIQLHQSQHSEEAYGEADDIEYGGYLKTVGSLLGMLQQRVAAHWMTCNECRRQDGNQYLVRPSKNVVHYTYVVAEIVKTLVDAYLIFVSKRAFDAYTRLVARKRWEKCQTCSLP